MGGRPKHNRERRTLINDQMPGGTSGGPTINQTDPTSPTSPASSAGCLGLARGDQPAVAPCDSPARCCSALQESESDRRPSHADLAAPLCESAWCRCGSACGSALAAKSSGLVSPSPFLPSLDARIVVGEMAESHTVLCRMRRPWVMGDAGDARNCRPKHQFK